MIRIPINCICILQYFHHIIFLCFSSQFTIHSSGQDSLYVIQFIILCKIQDLKRPFKNTLFWNASKHYFGYIYCQIWLQLPLAQSGPLAFSFLAITRLCSKTEISYSHFCHVYSKKFQLGSSMVMILSKCCSIYLKWHFYH